MIAGTFREEDVGRSHPLRAVHQDLRAEQFVTTLSLMRLSPADVEDIVARMPVAAADPAALARLGYQRSEGNPLFLTEALRDSVAAAEWSGSEILRAAIASRVDSPSAGGGGSAE